MVFNFFYCDIVAVLSGKHIFYFSTISIQKIIQNIDNNTISYQLLVWWNKRTTSQFGSWDWIMKE